MGCETSIEAIHENIVRVISFGDKQLQGDGSRSHSLAMKRNLILLAWPLFSTPAP